jgi:Arc/MetJ-type ribon-helix-helix transcriptional regulator
MANTQRVSISISKERAAQVQELVSKGAYPTVSAAYEAAADVLVEQEIEKAAWWAETIRRCEEAERHPERLLDHETFWNKVREEIGRRKQILQRS